LVVKLFWVGFIPKQEQPVASNTSVVACWRNFWWVSLVLDALVEAESAEIAEAIIKGTWGDETGIKFALEKVKGECPSEGYKTYCDRII
jgi:hypothetical protein